MPSSICQCDKPLEPLGTCPTYSNSFYPLQLFLPFHMYSNLPVHKYPSFIFVEQPTNISPQSFSSLLSLTLYLSLISHFSLFLSTSLSLSRSLSLTPLFCFSSLFSFSLCLSLSLF